MCTIMSGLAPRRLLDFVPNRVEARTRYNLRNIGQLEVPFARLETYSQSFLPSTTRLWNELQTEVKDSSSVKSFKFNYLKDYPRPTTNPLYYRGNRHVSVHHSQMCIGCSGLKAHLHHRLHVIDSPVCTCPSGQEETVKHYFLKCMNYTAERHTMLNSLAQLQHPQPSQNILLYEDSSKDLTHNASILETVHKYIASIKRFSI
jgi:hypothetical protein